MNQLDDEIRRVLTDEQSLSELDREQGIFRQPLWYGLKASCSAKIISSSPSPSRSAASSECGQRSWSMTCIFHGKLRWMGIFAIIESIVCTALMVLATIAFFRADDIRWQIAYATAVLLLGMMLLLVKLWGWGQMNRYSIQREIKRLELRMLELHGSE